MLTNNEIKLLRKLKQKKFRDEYQLFIVEGKKSVSEVVNNHFPVQNVYATHKYLAEIENIFPQVELITKTQSEQISAMSTDPEIFALVQMPAKKTFQADSYDKILVLDAVRDAGNLGTIIRTADWFDIHCIVCSSDCVDLYNPKTIQSSMGSFTRVDVFYSPLTDFILQNKQNYRFYGTFMEGDAIGEIKFAEKTAIVLGSESHGISPEVAALLDEKISIPMVGKSDRSEKPESLNVSISAAVCCYELSKMK